MINKFFLLPFSFALFGCSPSYLYVKQNQEVENKVCSSIIKGFSLISGNTVDLRTSMEEPCKPTLDSIRKLDQKFSVLEVTKDSNEVNFSLPAIFTFWNDRGITRWVDKNGYLSDHLSAGDTVYSINNHFLDKRVTADMGLSGKVGGLVKIDYAGNDGAKLSAEIKVYKFPKTSFYSKKFGEKTQYLFPIHMDKKFTEFLSQKLNDKTIDTLILDLRGSPGGLLAGAINVLEMMVQKDSLLFTVNRYKKPNRNIEYWGKRTQGNLLEIFVFLDHYTFGSSEIVAEVLSHYAIAKTVGERSPGEMTVMSFISMGKGYGVAASSGELVPPSNSSIQSIGVSPEIRYEELQKFPRINSIYHKMLVIPQE